MQSSSIIPPLRLVFLMWLTFTIELYIRVDFGFLGILPRTVSGLIGIFTAPLVHGDLNHLISNTFPLLFLGAATFFFYPKVAVQVFLQCYFLTNLMVWLLGREFYHIGASGLIYGLAAFLIASGIFKRDFRAILVSCIVLVVYGSIFFGLLPSSASVSWESHLFGALIGLAGAYLFRNK